MPKTLDPEDYFEAEDFLQDVHYEISNFCVKLEASESRALQFLKICEKNSIFDILDSGRLFLKEIADLEQEDFKNYQQLTKYLEDSKKEVVEKSVKSAFGIFETIKKVCEENTNYCYRFVEELMRNYLQTLQAEPVAADDEASAVSLTREIFIPFAEGRESSAILFAEMQNYFLTKAEKESDNFTAGYEKMSSDEFARERKRLGNLGGFCNFLQIRIAIERENIETTRVKEAQEMAQAAERPESFVEEELSDCFLGGVVARPGSDGIFAKARSLVRQDLSVKRPVAIRISSNITTHAQ